MSQDINLASDDDLLEELKSRYHSVAIGLWRPHKNELNIGIFKLRWHGDSFTAAGLCSALQDEINNSRRENEGEHDEDT